MYHHAALCSADGVTMAAMASAVRATCSSREIVKCIQGESSFCQDVLAELIQNTEQNCKELSQTMEDAAAELQDAEEILSVVTSQYDELISYAELYDSASIETKKMIVNCLINRVEVGRGYKLNIAFNFHLSQFFCGLDLDASA